MADHVLSSRSGGARALPAYRLQQCGLQHIQDVVIYSSSHLKPADSLPPFSACSLLHLTELIERRLQLQRSFKAAQTSFSSL